MYLFALFYFFTLCFSLQSRLHSERVDSSKDSGNWHPSLYQSYSEPHQTIAMKVLQNLRFKGNEKVLDIGSGNGQISEMIAKKLPNGSVVGIDISDEMVAFANRTYSDVSNLNFKKANAEDFELNEKFDLIVSFNSLHFVSNHRATLQQIHKHLIPKGHVILSLSPPPKILPLIEAIDSTCKDVKWAPFMLDFHENTFMPEMTPQEYRQLLEDVGFKVTLCERVKHHSVFKNRSAFVDWIEAWLPHVSKIPKERQKEFSEEIADKYLESTSQKNGSQVIFIHFPWEVEAYAKEFTAK